MTLGGDSNPWMGTAQKEGVLTLAVLDYLVMAIQEGDMRALTDMGVGPRDVPWLLDMCQWDRQLWMRSALLPVHVSIDVDRLNRIQERMGRQRASYEVVAALARGDAPVEMMRALCGMGRRSYRGLRRSLGLSGMQAGRRAQPDDGLKLELDALAEAAGGIDAIGATECLDFNRRTGASLAAIWDWLAERRRPEQ